MKPIKLIIPTALIAMLAITAPRANAQTMGEYAGVTASVGTSGGSMGTSLSSSMGSSDVGGGSSTWGANGLGASFDERAGAAASSSGGDFESRAGSSASASGSDSRWPGSQFDSSGGFGGDSADRFGSGNRFSGEDRFTANSQLSSSSDRFPSTALDSNKSGLDQHYDESGLDSGGSSAGLSN